MDIRRAFGTQRVVRRSRGKVPWFALHRWMALPVWLLLFFVCLTGTLATVDKELLWLFDAAARAANPHGLGRLPVGRLVGEVERQIPAAHVRSIAFDRPYLALDVTIRRDGLDDATARVDPFTGRVQELVTGSSFADLLRGLHGWLLTSWANGTAIGWYAVTLLSLPMLGSLVTGLVVYKRFWRALLAPRLRTDQGSRVLWGDVHRLAGAWGLGFLALIALSGLWFCGEGVLLDAHVALRPAAPHLARRDLPSPPSGTAAPRPDIDAALAAVQRRHPGSAPRYVTLPDRADAPIAIYSRGPVPLLGRTLWADPRDGALLAPAALPVFPFETVTAVAASLHFGDFGGLAGRLIWFAGGLVLSLLVFSGMVVWIKRTIRPALPSGRTFHPASDRTSFP